MEIRKLTNQISVAPQIMANDVPAIVAAGFRSVICNRPDNEETGQPCCDAIAQAVKAAGLTWHNQPIISGTLSLRDAKVFASLISELPKPVLAYCRTGTRCVMLWCLSQVEQRPMFEILSTAQAAGYNVAGPMEHILGSYSPDFLNNQPENRQ